MSPSQSGQNPAGEEGNAADAQFQTDQQAPRAASKGLLSSWKSGATANSSMQPAPQARPSEFTEQATFMQPSMPGPVTGPAGPMDTPNQPLARPGTISLADLVKSDLASSPFPFPQQPAPAASPFANLASSPAQPPIGAEPQAYPGSGFQHPAQPVAFQPSSQPLQPSAFPSPSQQLQYPGFSPASQPLQHPGFSPASQPLQHPGFPPPSQPLQHPGFSPASQPLQQSTFSAPSQPLYPGGFQPPSQPLYPNGFQPPSQPLSAPWQANRTGDLAYQNNNPLPQTPPGGGQPPRNGKNSRKKKRFPIWARVLVAVLTVLMIAAGAGAWYYQTNFASTLSHVTGQQAAHIGKDGDANPDTTTMTNKGIGNKRINILLLGSDNDGKNEFPLAQTVIVVTIDPNTHYVGMLSIPRDMRVVIPNNGTGKIDAAFAYGAMNEHVGPTPFSNAVGLMIATVEKNFNIPIDYYAWVGLDGFVKVIDTAGGVDIDAIHPITDNSYPDDVGNGQNVHDYKRLYIPPGPQHMNGIQALEYVRTRHADLVGDFGRSARQQQILSQLKTKLDTPGIIQKLPELAKDLENFVKTDMQLTDIVNFMGFARNLDPNKIDRAVLSPPYSSPAQDNTGDFLPNCSMITPKIAQIFDLAGKATCIPMASAPNSANNGYASASPTTSNTHAVASQQSATSKPSLQALGPANQNALSLQQAGQDPFGVRSVLDLMCLVVFESFDGTKV